MPEKLAIAGGKPILKREDYQNWPVITDDDRRFVNEVLDSGIVAGGTGPQVVALEKEWAEFVGIECTRDDIQSADLIAHEFH